MPTYEDFNLPEDVQVDKEKLSEFTKELGELQNLTKADQKLMQEFGQKMVDRAIALQQETAQRLTDYYTGAWEKQKNDWKESFEKDPEIGGNRSNTTINAALQFIRTHGGDEKQQTEFRDLMNQTGIGNHPAMIRMLSRANSVISEGKPVPASMPAAKPTSKVQKRYGNM